MYPFLRKGGLVELRKARSKPIGYNSYSKISIRTLTLYGCQWGSFKMIKGTIEQENYHERT